MSRKLGLTVFATFFLSSLIAQDGSNIKYFEPTDLDSSFIGRYCHIDIGEDSFGGKAKDTIEINLKGQKMRFIEHHKDNGFTNWFRDQYWIREEQNKPMSTRLQNSRIDSLSTDRIYLTSVLSYYMNDSPIDSTTFFQHEFELKNIAKVLVKE
jgi:hypothetical protein